MKMSDFKEVTELRGQLNTIRLLIDKIDTKHRVRLHVDTSDGPDIFMYASQKNMIVLLKAEASDLVAQLSYLGVEIDE
jgi:hypothetical protein